MRKYSIIIADDEFLTRERISSLVKKFPQFHIVGEAANGIDCLKMIRQYQPDVVFLDIRMPRLNGFEVINLLDKEDYKILVFITAYDQYAIKAFENEALDYLLKPFDNSRFDQLMNRLQKQLAQIHQSSNKFLLVKDNNEIHKIKIRDIIFLKSDNNYVQIFLEKTILKKRISITSIISQLDPHFHRIHRSYIINDQEIIKMKHVQHGDYLFLMSNGKSVPSSKTYRSIIEKLIR